MSFSPEPLPPPLPPKDGDEGATEPLIDRSGSPPPIGWMPEVLNTVDETSAPPWPPDNPIAAPPYATAVAQYPSTPTQGAQKDSLARPLPKRTSKSLPNSPLKSSRMGGAEDTEEAEPTQEGVEPTRGPRVRQHKGNTYVEVNNGAKMEKETVL